MTLFHQVVQQQFEAVNQTIRQQLKSSVPLIETIGEHIVDGGGKRLRPLMAILSALATNYDESSQRHIQLAVAIEFIHIATLLHDDVVDKSLMRRGKPTTNALWDNSAAVLVGDFLYSRAFELLTAIGNMSIMHEFAMTTNSIAEGEVKQLVNIGRVDLSQDDYIDIVTKKTAILFSAAMRSGSQLTDSNDHNTTNTLGDYGMAVGIAFQIHDDVLDYLGDEAATGKNVGTDLAEGKLTLPLIFALKNGSANQRRQLLKIIDSKDLKQLATVTQILHDTKALEQTRQVASHYRDQAIAHLQGLADSSYQQALVQIAEFTIERDS